VNRAPILFALEGSRDLGARVAARLGVPLSAHEERAFEDGEHKARPLVSVRGRDVFVLDSLHADDRRSPNDRLCRLLFFSGAVRDASAARVTAVVPYLCYARKDRRTKSRDPVTTRYVAGLFEAVGVDRVIAIDVHNLAAFENSFRCPTDHIEAAPLLVEHLLGRTAGASSAVPWPFVASGEAVVLSPDAGGVKRAERFRERLEARLGRPVGSAFAEKYRSGGVVSGQALAGEVSGRVVVAVDDLIATGTTLVRSAKACRARGATAFLAVATHGAFTREAAGVLADPAVDRILITDTISPPRLAAGPAREKLGVADSSGLLAAAIRAVHEERSLGEALGGEP
jgi:ribose-phosphate pyrophosphokinase